MKIKNIVIEIRPLKDTLKEFAEVFGKIKNDEKVIPKRGLGFSNVEDFRKFFSKKRMELLSIIKQRKPKSVYELAKISKRAYKNVYDDIALLDQLGLITRENHHVDVEFNKLHIEIAV